MLYGVISLLLPAAAFSGWLIGSRARHSHSDMPSGRLREDYFKGLNYLINEQPDKAVDVFIHLLEVDSETVETHLALGNLFRRKGEMDRAIRVHQNIIARPQLSKPHRDSALQALGQDYLAAGVLDRAERVFLDLIKFGNENNLVLSSLMRLYQQEKDWRKAIQIARRLKSRGLGKMINEIAQFYCELAEEEMGRGQFPEAQKYLKQALSTNKACERAVIQSARIALLESRFEDAIRMVESEPGERFAYWVLRLGLLAQAHAKLDSHAAFVDFLSRCIAKKPVLLTQLDVIIAGEDVEVYRTLLAPIKVDIVDSGDPSPIGLVAMIRSQLVDASSEAACVLEALLAYSDVFISRCMQYQCEYCGFSSESLFWSCPGCHKWETMELCQVNIQ